MPCHVMSCHAISCHVMSFRFILFIHSPRTEYNGRSHTINNTIQIWRKRLFCIPHHCKFMCTCTLNLALLECSGMYMISFLFLVTIFSTISLCIYYHPEYITTPAQYIYYYHQDNKILFYHVFHFANDVW